MSDDALTLNIRATQALRGVTENWQADVLALLESDAPIEPMFRKELAEVIARSRDGEPAGIKLKLEGHKAEKDISVGAKIRYQYMEIGEWIVDRISEGDKRHDALKNAADKFHSSVQKCDAALTYYQKAKRWIDCALETPLGSEMPRDLIESLYHARAAGGRNVAHLNRQAFEVFDTAYFSSNRISGMGR